MKRVFKRILAVTLIVCLSVISTSAISVSAAEVPDNGIMPCYNNTASTLTNMNIDSSGELSIAYQYTGYPDLATHAVITTYIERKAFGLIWVRVDNGEPDDQWVDTIYSSSHTAIRTCRLTKTGTFRVTVVYKIYGSGGNADVIEYQGTDSY